MSRRDLIRMTDQEVAEFLAEPRTVAIATRNPDDSVHLVAMWFAPLANGALGFETFSKSQKVLNLRRDPRMTALVEAGDSYDQLRGVELVGQAEVIDDHELLMEIARGVIARYQPEVGSNDVDAVAEMMVAKRSAVVFRPEKVVSWDHRKLGGTY